MSKSRLKGSMDLSFRSPVMDDDCVCPYRWIGLVPVFPLVLWRWCLGDRKNTSPIENHFHQSPGVLFQNSWRRRTWRGTSWFMFPWTKLLLQLFYDPLSGTTRVSWYQKDKPFWILLAVASAEPYASYLHFAPEDNHVSTSSLKFLRTRCSSWHPTNSVKALKAYPVKH